MKNSNIIIFSATILLTIALPLMGFAGVESTLNNVQNTLINTILPIMGAIGLVWASFSFFTGNPNARNHLVLAIVGALVGFLAPSIISFVRALVH